MRKVQNQQGELTPHDLRTSLINDIIIGLIHWTIQRAPFLDINNAKSILINPTCPDPKSVSAHHYSHTG